MADTIPKPHTQTSLESRQSPADFKPDDRNAECVSNAARVSVITSTYSLPGSSDQNSDKIIMIANSKPHETKLETKKPYGGRPLKYECSQCQRRFHAPSHLKRHVMSHSSERPFQCAVCGKGFLQAWHLGRHMTTHTGNKPFKCADCSKSFGSRFEMRTHINYIHKGIKEHKCDVCGKHFTLRSNLKVHMRKHTGEKPYQCSFCSKRFGQRGHLQYHIRKHEGKDETTRSQQTDSTKKSTKASSNAVTKDGSIPEVSECHDEDCECDSGIGSYDSEAESSTCSSPVIHDSNDEDHQNKTQVRPSSPEYVLAETCRRSPLKRTYAEVQKREIKPYVCHLCSCGFLEVNSLRAHVRHSHPRKGIIFGDYSCGFCLQHFSTIETLGSHVETRCSPKASRLQDKSYSSRSFSEDPKSKMSAKSLAFSIENICANSTPKHASKEDDQDRSPLLIGSSFHEPLFRPVAIPSIPMTFPRSTLSEFTPPPSSGSFFKSHVSAFCQCHFDRCYLQVQ